jgi:hypothetical protein
MLQDSRGYDNTRTIRVREIEERVHAAHCGHLLAPDVIASAVEGLCEEWRKLSEQRGKQRAELERGLRPSIVRRLKATLSAPHGEKRRRRSSTCAYQNQPRETSKSRRIESDARFRLWLRLQNKKAS